MQRQTDTTSSYRIPQGWKAARVDGCSGAIFGLPFLFPLFHTSGFYFLLRFVSIQRKACNFTCSSTNDFAICLKEMYIIKVKGKAKIPDYIQLRDNNFVLVAYFRADRPLKKLEKYGLEGKEIELSKIIENLSYGKLEPLNI